MSRGIANALILDLADQNAKKQTLCSTVVNHHNHIVSVGVIKLHRFDKSDEVGDSLSAALINFITAQRHIPPNTTRNTTSASKTITLFVRLWHGSFIFKHFLLSFSKNKLIINLKILSYSV